MKSKITDECLDAMENAGDMMDESELLTLTEIYGYEDDEDGEEKAAEAAFDDVLKAMENA